MQIPEPTISRDAVANAVAALGFDPAEMDRIAHIVIYPRASAPVAVEVLELGDDGVTPDPRRLSGYNIPIKLG